jgi:hypothetical protein
LTDTDDETITFSANPPFFSRSPVVLIFTVDLCGGLAELKGQVGGCRKRSSFVETGYVTDSCLFCEVVTPGSLDGESESPVEKMANSKACACVWRDISRGGGMLF